MESATAVESGTAVKSAGAMGEGVTGVERDETDDRETEGEDEVLEVVHDGAPFRVRPLIQQEACRRARSTRSRVGAVSVAHEKPERPA